MPLRTIRLVFLALICFALASCDVSKTTLSSINITPTSAVLGADGQTAQFRATGTYLHGSAEAGHPRTSRDITGSVTWTSSNASVATIDNNGLATAEASGTTTITASMDGLSNSVPLAVGPAGTVDATLTSVTVIPNNQQLGASPAETSQFIAVGTFSQPPLSRDLTGLVTWSSSDIGVATIDSAGLATTGTLPGTTTIAALAKTVDGGAMAGTAILTTSGGGSGQIPTLSIYMVGLGSGTVTSIPAGINCASGAGCTDYFPVGTVVTLTELPGAGSAFGGWSSNCVPPTPNANTCTVTAADNNAVGAIFNKQ